MKQFLQKTAINTMCYMFSIQVPSIMEFSFSLVACEFSSGQDQTSGGHSWILFVTSKLSTLVFKQEKFKRNFVFYTLIYLNHFFVSVLPFPNSNITIVLHGCINQKIIFKKSPPI